MTRALPPAAGAAVFYVAITVALAYPLLGGIGSLIAPDAGDPILNTWILWWSTQTVPLTASWWSAPIFHPMANAMALSEILLGLLPISWVVQTLTGNALAAYNVVFLLSFPLCGLAAYALALEVTGRRDAALIAGVAFACAPYRMAQLSHLQMLSYYWTPLALLGLHRYLATRRTAMLVLFGAAWLMQSLSNSYAMFHLSILVGLWILWFVRDVRTMAAIGAAWMAAAAPMIPILWRYRDVHAQLHLVRDINEIKRFGADVADFLSAPRDLLAWGASLGSPSPETAIFPGLTVVLVGAVWIVLEWRRGRFHEAESTRERRLFMALAAAAALIAFSTIAIGPWRIGPLTISSFYKPFSLAVGFRLLASLRSTWMRRAWGARSVPGFYVVAMIALYLLALGPEPRLLGRPLLYEPPYAWFMRIPGFDVMRVPARFAMAAVLCQAVLVALAIAKWTRMPRATATKARARAPSIVTAICLGLLVDGWVRLPVAAPPEGPGPDWRDVAAPPAGSGPAWQKVAAVVELPPGDPAVDFGAMYRSIAHKTPIVNAFSGYYPPHYLPLAYAVRHGRYEALRELVSDRPLGVAIDRSRADAAGVMAALDKADGVTRRTSDGRWTTYVARPATHVPVTLGEEIPIALVTANRHPEDVGRMRDGSMVTAWGSGVNQIGDEDVVVELASAQVVGSIVLGMGAYAFGFPRQLDIEVALDPEAWVPIWSGDTSVATVRAAVGSPSVVPLTLEVGPQKVRRIRLRQRGAEPGIPWWIAEIRVHAPPRPALPAPDGFLTQ